MTRTERVRRLAVEMDRHERDYERLPQGSTTPGRLWFVADRVLERIDEEAAAAVSLATDAVLGGT